MKTLKKTLCLVLAMVMVFGLCAVSASAKLGYGDTDDITYKEAVDVMSGIGILSGDARGFRPTDKITRAEAAKILAYIIIGDAKQADAVKATRDPFADVPASHWAAGYIDYCASAGVIMGKADGYHPSDNVTGLEFAAMLLRALGYGKQAEYVGTDWAINTSKDALRLGIFEDNVGGANTDPATREECALYAFNAVTEIKKVSYSSLLGTYITSGSVLGDTADANMGGTFADDFKLKSTGADLDAFKCEAGHYWYIDSGKREAITANYGGSSHLREMYTTKVTGGDIYSLIADASKADSFELWVDGVELTADDYVAGEGDDLVIDPASDFKKGNETKVNGSGNGVETYVYSWYTDKKVDDKTVSELNIKICVVNTYLAQVDEVTEGTAKKDPKTIVKVMDDLVEVDDDGYATEEFDEDDYVLITVAEGEIQSMVAAEIIEDEVTRFSQDGTKKSIVVNGTTYTKAENVASPGGKDGMAADAITRSIVDGKDHKIFVDKHGYVIGVNSVKTESNYVFVSHFGDKTDVSGDFNESGISAKIYYADGTNAVVPVKSVNGEDVVTDGVGVDPGALDKGIYKLEMKSSKAVLTDGPNGTNQKDASGNPKKSRPSTVTVTDATVDNKTVFFYVYDANDDDGIQYSEWDKDDFVVTVYTGINSVPANKDGDATAKTAIIDGTKVGAVLVENTSNGDSSDTVYIYTGKYDTDRDGWTAIYETYVDGKKDELRISYSTSDAKDDGVDEFTKDEGNVVGKFFTVKGKNPVKVGTGTREFDKSKYYDSLSTADDADETVTISALDKSEIIFGNSSTGYAFAEGKDLTIVDLSGNDTKITKLDKLVDAFDNGNDIEVAIQVKDSVVIAMYIVNNDPPTAEGDED